MVQIHQSDSGSTQPADVGRQRGQRKRKITDRQLALQKKQKDVIVEVQNGKAQLGERKKAKQIASA